LPPLQIQVTADEAGPVLALSGEMDMASVPALSDALDAQLSGGIRELTADLSGLHFADSASLRQLLLTARTLRERGGDLVLLNPQPSVARILDLLGIDQLVTVRTCADGHGAGAG
jgi:anti-anti-sigma factor